MNEYTTKENKITLFKNVDENTEYKFYPIGFDEYKDCNGGQRIKNDLPTKAIKHKGETPRQKDGG